MSVCSRSSLAAAVLSVVLAMLAPAPVAASSVRETVVTNDDGSVTKRIELNGRLIAFSRISSDTTVTDSTGLDTLEAGLVRVEHGANDVVRLFADAYVAQGEKVDGDVVSVFGSVRVDGEVAGDAVAVFGGLHLGEGARVAGDAVAIFGSMVLDRAAAVAGDAVVLGGGMRKADDARVLGSLAEIGFMPLLTLGLPGLPVVLLTLLLAWLVSVGLGWVGAVLFPRRLARVAATASRRTGLSLLLGAFAGPLAFVLGILLLVTVIGIPIALMLPLAWVFVSYAGQLAATYQLGCKLLRRAPGSGGAFAPIAAGSFLVMAFFAGSALLWDSPGLMRMAALFVGLVGVLLLTALSWLGTGAFLLSRAGSRPGDVMPQAPVVPAAAPAAAPAPAAAQGPEPPATG